MRKYYFILCLLILISCEENKPRGVCGQGNNLCFEMNGTIQAFDARWKEEPYGYSVDASKLVGTDTISMQLLFSQTKPTVDYLYFDGSSIPIDGIVIYDDYYTNYNIVNITNVFENCVSGGFDAIVSQDTNAYHITKGHLDAIPHQ